MKVELTTIELKALQLKDINNYNDRKCADMMNIDVKEFNNIISIARKKVIKALIDGNEITIIDISTSEGINGLMISNAAHLSSWTNETVTLPIDEDKFYALLMEKAASSKAKEDVVSTVTMDMSSTF